MIIFHTARQLLLRTEDGRHVWLAERIRFRRDDGAEFMMEVGTPSDMASTPQAIWSTGLAPFGTYTRATIVHDGGYQNTLLRQRTDGSWAPANLTKDECDTLLLDCMVADGVSLAERDIIYEGVRFGGFKAFRDDRSFREVKGSSEATARAMLGKAISQISRTETALGKNRFNLPVKMAPEVGLESS